MVCNEALIKKLILSQWMGCAKAVWNAKCDQDK
jgi:putative transposase